MRASSIRKEDWPDEFRPVSELGPKVGRRGAARLRLSIPARLITLEDTRRCICVDLSRSGAQLALERPLALGESCVLQIGPVEPFGNVVRMARRDRGGTNGIAFDGELTDAHVLDVRQFAEGLAAAEQEALRREAREWVSGVI